MALTVGCCSAWVLQLLLLQWPRPLLPLLLLLMGRLVMTNSSSRWDMTQKGMAIVGVSCSTVSGQMALTTITSSSSSSKMGRSQETGRGCREPPPPLLLLVLLILLLLLLLVSDRQELPMLALELQV
jgi:hypothetical protein